MTNQELCFDVWTIRNVETDDLGQENWDNEDEVDYYHADEEVEEENEEESGCIEQYQDEQEMRTDFENFGANLINSFISMVF